MSNPLDNMDVRVLVDVSGSMNRGGRFQAAIAAAAAFAGAAAEIDDDGIELGVFGAGAKMLGNATTAEEAASLLSGYGARDGWTETDKAVKLGAENRNPSKNTLCVIFTDGAPNAQGYDAATATANAIIDVSQTLAPSPNNPDDSDELTYLFVQVGDDDAAAAWLAQLDDDLEGMGARFDIVDAKNANDIAGRDIYEVAMEAIND